MLYLLLFILFSIFIIWWNTSVPRSESYKKVVKLSFDFIKNLYAVSPDRFRYERVEKKSSYRLTLRKALMINYYSDVKDMWNHDYFYRIVGRKETNAYYYNKHIVGVKLSIIDKIKFIVAKYRNPNDKKIMEGILEVMQLDIDRLKEQADKQIKQAETITKAIAENSFPTKLGTVYFSNRHGQLEKIKENVPFDNVKEVIVRAVKEKNPLFQIHYIRNWKENNNWIFDVESHIEFFIFKEEV